LGISLDILAAYWPELCTGISAITNGMDLNNIKPVDYCQKHKQPVLFLQAVDDELVSLQNSEQLFEAYAGNKKELTICEGDHNSQRGADVVR
jgi:fermentation-respiration switch protein FrsA (DUF1100 family)